MYDLISNLTQLVKTNLSTDIIITGDFNLPDINWDTLSATSTSSNAFCDFIFDNLFNQLVDLYLLMSKVISLTLYSLTLMNW